jgi:hypothetical protein
MIRCVYLAGEGGSGGVVLSCPLLALRQFLIDEEGVRGGVVPDIWCHSGVTVVSQWCYSGVTVVLQWCPSGVTVV